jgi:hypothetical protein
LGIGFFQNFQNQRTLSFYGFFFFLKANKKEITTGSWVFENFQRINGGLLKNWEGTNGLVRLIDRFFDILRIMILSQNQFFLI